MRRLARVIASALARSTALRVGRMTELPPQMFDRRLSARFAFVGLHGQLGQRVLACR